MTILGECKECDSNVITFTTITTPQDNESEISNLNEGVCNDCNRVVEIKFIIKP